MPGFPPPILTIPLAMAAAIVGPPRAERWAAVGAATLLLPPSALLALLAAWWMYGTIAGASGGWVSGVGEIPLSPAAEHTLAPLPGSVAFRLAGAPRG